METTSSVLSTLQTINNSRLDHWSVAQLIRSSSSSFYFANVEHRQQQVRVAIVAGQQGSELH